MAAAGVHVSGRGGPGPWVMLACVPDVTSGAEKFPRGKDLSIHWDAPPRCSRLTVSQRVVPDPFNYLCITADDPTGRLLLYAAEGTETEPLVVDDTPDHGLTLRRKSIEAYLLCDATTGTVSRLPDDSRLDIKLGMVGLICQK